MFRVLKLHVDASKINEEWIKQSRKTKCSLFSVFVCLERKRVCVTLCEIYLT